MRSSFIIPKTGYYTSIISYAAFWLLELARPGFVSRFVSVHVFLLAAIAFGLWWGAVPESPKRERGHGFLAAVAVLFAVLAGMVTWNLSDAMDSGRWLVALAAALVPIVFVGLLSSDT